MLIRKIKKGILLIAVSALSFSLFSCGIEKQERFSMDVDTFADNLNNGIDFSTELEKQPADKVRIYFDVEDEVQAAMYNTSLTCEEIAVFKATDDEKAEKVTECVNEFVKGQIDTFAVYSAEDAERLENAVVVSKDYYVVLVVCDSPSDARSVVDSIFDGSFTRKEKKTTEASTEDVSSEDTEEITEETTDITSEETTEEITEDTTEEETEETTDVTTEETTEAYTGDNILYAKEVKGKVKVYNAITVIGDTGYSFYGYSKKNTQAYADALNKLADNLDGISTVYSIPIPLACDITMPEEYAEYNRASDRNSVIEHLTKSLSDKVKLVDSGDLLKAHKDEYIYFRTDHHWTALGAYYTYTEFCKQKGIKAEGLGDYKTKIFDDYVGSYAYDKKKVRDQALVDNPDTLMAYYPTTGNKKMTVTKSDGSTFEWDVIHDVSNYSSSRKYAAFAAGDYPSIVIKNDSITDGSSCVVIKDSFGNAFIPFLVDHYQTIYELDVRYWSGSLSDFAQKNNVNDIIFALAMTNVESSYTSGKIGSLCK